ncbi:MAG TPA: menaquinone biosynthesis prenyltransferase MqnP [Actinocrinis sp.]|nr:menaquinone biosynthesis prenyltransferase MqnP [Actinocrinis sp.]
MSTTADIVRPESFGGRAKAFKNLVLLEHSVFALPFAYISALTAMFLQSGTVHWRQLLLITLAMVGARSFAMAVNRIIDRKYDALNPRTAKRELVTGVLSVRAAWTGALVALGVFLVTAALLNPLSLALAPLAVVPLVVYPYGKRFTDFPHAILALAQAIGPIGAWVAVTGRWSWDAVVLGLAVGIWIGGFDLIFACQDIETDRESALRSVPARWGVAAALYGARTAHAVVLALFVLFGRLTHAEAFWWLGLVVVASAFCYEHSLVKPDDLSRLNRAFFTVNGFVGIALFCFALADLVARGLQP